MLPRSYRMKELASQAKAVRPRYFRSLDEHQALDGAGLLVEKATLQRGRFPSGWDPDVAVQRRQGQAAAQRSSQTVLEGINAAEFRSDADKRGSRAQRFAALKADPGDAVHAVGLQLERVERLVVFAVGADDEDLLGDRVSGSSLGICRTNSSAAFAPACSRW